MLEYWNAMNIMKRISAIFAVPLKLSTAGKIDDTRRGRTVDVCEIGGMMEKNGLRVQRWTKRYIYS